MKFQYLLIAFLACLVSVSLNANHDDGFRIDHEAAQSGLDTYRLSWIAKENGMYVLEGNPDLRSEWFPITRAPDFEQNEPALLEDELVELNVQTHADRFFYQLVTHEGVYISARCEDGEGVILEVDISGWAEIKPTPYINSYVIERSTSLEGPFTVIAESTNWIILDALPLRTGFTDRLVSPNTQYFYRARFTDDSDIESPPSNIASVTTSCDPPSPLLFSASCAPGRIALEWDLPPWAMEVNYGEFVIMRSTSPEGPFTILKAFVDDADELNAKSFSDFTATGGPFYYYFYFTQYDPITGFELTSPESEIVSADPATCTAPEGPELIASCREDRIVLRWNGPAWATGELAIVDWFIERATNPAGPYTPIVSNYISPGSGGMYVDDAVSPGVLYHYRASFRYDSLWNNLSVDGPRISPYSEIASASTCDVPIKGPIDIAFIVDNTGSMENALGELRAEISNILDDIEASSGTIPDYRLGLVTPDNDIVNVRVPFAQNNRFDFETALMSLAAEGGGGFPESTDESLNTVVNGLWECHRGGQAPDCPWRTEVQIGNFFPPFGADEQGNSRSAHKIVVFITDDRPGGFCDEFTPAIEENAARYAEMARCNDIRIAAILVGSGNGAIPVMQNYVDTTCGWYAQLPLNGTNIDQAILNIL